jgi:glycosyltransferase involved in cell wall biosynthesis
MDILIKSFNRPFYLDRCLRSVYEQVSGSFRVLVLDDGTPPRYLARIQKKYPNVIISRSPHYLAKVEAIEAHISGIRPFNQKLIPIAFWVEKVEQATEYFLLLEDDIWLTDKLNLSSISQTMMTEGLVMVKLYWYNNSLLNSGRIVPLSNEVEEVVPHIPLSTRTIFLNDFKVRSVLYRLGLFKVYNDFKLWLPLYTFYSVASAIFCREYWLTLWPAEQAHVNEANQLRAAVTYHRQRRSRVAKTTKEYTRDSHTSSATNTYVDVNLDPFILSHILNEAWLNDEFDSYTDFPADFSPAAIKPILDAAADKRATYGEWMRWAERRKAQYRVLGCQVD